MLPRWIWAVYAALLAASVPWYVPDGPLRLWMGLPHWLEILIQVAPLVMLGVHWSRLTAPAALAGLIAGLGVSFALPLAGYARPFGVHDGVIGALANLAVCLVWSQAAAAREPSAVREATA